MSSSEHGVVAASHEMNVVPETQRENRPSGREGQRCIKMRDRDSERGGQGCRERGTGAQRAGHRGPAEVGGWVETQREWDRDSERERGRESQREETGTEREGTGTQSEQRLRPGNVTLALPDSAATECCSLAQDGVQHPNAL